MRVDAARAIAKLREYQLEEKTGWVLEAVRAAVASGAQRVHVQGDSNDVWLRWEGEPWPAEDLPRLFDELVSPEVKGDRQHVRLLAMAVNSALGLEPAYVDVYAVESEGKAVRARYRPEVLIPPEDELGEAPLHRLAVEEATAPLRTRRGMLVHLRRKLGFKVLAYFLREEPRELELVREACRDLAVPILVGKDEQGRHQAQRDVARVELGEDLQGFLAVTDPPSPDEIGPGGQMEISERGVVLVREEWLIELRHMAGAPRLPLRLFLDAPQLPTNAARSQVRKDAHPMTAARRRALQLLPELIAQLVARLAATAPASHERGLEALARFDARARAAALAILGGSGPRWSWRMAPAMVALEQQPLVCDAAGTLRPVTRLWRPFVHDGRTPLPAELAPWVGDVLWIPPGDAAGHLVPEPHYDAAALRDHLRWARRQLAAKRDFYAMPASEPRVRDGAKVRLSASLDAALAGSCVPDELFGELRGKVCVLTEGGSTLHLFLEGRPIEEIPYRSAIPFAVAIDAAFTPTDFYQGVVRDALYARAERAMLGAVIRAMEVLARRELEQPVPDGFTQLLTVERDEHARTIRAAATLVLEAQLELFGSLHQAKAWPSTDGEWMSLAEMASSPSKALGTTPRGLSKGGDHGLPRGRLIVEANEREHVDLVSLLPLKHVVRYEPKKRASQTSKQLAKRLLGEGRALALAIEAPRAAIALAPSLESRLRVFHCGVLLEDRNHTDDVGRFDVMVENDEAIPDDEWEKAAVSSVRREDVVEWKLAAVRAMASALVGRQSEALAVARPDELLAEVSSLFLEALVSRTPAQLFGAELLEALLEAPLFTVTGQADKWSARRLAIEIPGELKYLALSKGQELRALHRQLAGTVSGGDLGLIEEAMREMTVMLAEPRVAELVVRLGGHARATTVDRELVRLVQLGKRAQRQRAHLERAVQAKFEEGELHVEVDVPGGGERLRCAIALARPVPGTKVSDIRNAADRATGMAMSFFVAGRLLKQINLLASTPVYAAVDVSDELIDGSYDGLPAELMNELLRHIERALPRLLVAVAEAQPEAMAVAGSARSLLLRASRDKLLDGETLARLRQACSFATVQGGRVRLAELPRQLFICGWQGEWLAGQDLKAASEAPILAVPPADYELRNVLEALHDGWISDMTESVARLQGRRRNERGLVPRPVVPGARPELTRKLEDLGELGKALAPGELALVDEPTSTLLLHVQGELRERLEMREVLPAMKLAVEDTAQREPADHSQIDPSLSLSGALGRLDDEHLELAEQAQKLGIALVQQIAESCEVEELPAWVQRSLRVAVLTRRLVVPLMELPLFRTAGGDKVSWCDVAEQLELFDSVWALDEDEVMEGEPLDARRLVLRMAPDERELAQQNGRPVVNAANQLKIEAAARESRAKRLVSELRLPAGLDALAKVELSGDGVSAPRGIVAVLSARGAKERAFYPHREMVSLQKLDDECEWPTVAVVDDARLVTDWKLERALGGAMLEEVRGAVAAASARALAQAVRVPDDAVVSHRVVARPIAFRGGRGSMHGALWIREAPSALFEEAAEGVIICEDKVDREWERSSQLGLIGELHIYAPPGDPGQSQRIDEAVAEVCREAHREMVKQLLRNPDVDRDLLTAHAAMALARGDSLASVPASASLRFACFGPQPMEIAELALLFRHLRRVPVGANDYEAKSGITFIFDDGSRTARVLLPLVGRLSQEQMMALQARAKKVPAPPKEARRRAKTTGVGGANGASGAAASGTSRREEDRGVRAIADAPAASASPAAVKALPSASASAPAKASAAAAPIAPASPPLPPPGPPHPLQAMLVRTADRLIAAGIAHHPISIAVGSSSPMVTIHNGVVAFAGNHPKLRALAVACAANTAWHDDAIDLLVAHVICLLHSASDSNGVGRLDVTDALEQRALSRLLGAPSI